jgi:hypothetical protein
MTFLRDEGTRALGLVPLRLLVPFDMGPLVSWSNLCFNPPAVAFDRVLDKRFDRGLEVVVVCK